MSGLLTREHLRAWVGHIDQRTHAQVVTVLDGTAPGTRHLQIRTGGALDVDIALDRAGDISNVWASGVPIGWVSPSGNAKIEPRSGWEALRSFPGGLVTTCGLEHALAPELLDMSRYGYEGRPSELAPLHGRLMNSTARVSRLELVEHPHLGLGWSVGLEIRQAGLFAERFEMRRSVFVALDQPVLEFGDSITNIAAVPTPLALLYHVNFGWPFLSPETRFEASVDESALATEHSDWSLMGALRDDASQRFISHVLSPDEDGRAFVRITNPDLNGGRLELELAFNARALPELFQWTVPGKGFYVNAFEPGNLPAVGHVRALEEDRMTVLQPGEEFRTSLSFTARSDNR